MRELSNRSALVRHVVCATALTCLASAPAGAQGGGGPYAGLFGGNDKDQTQALDARASAFGAYDDSVLSRAPGGGGLSDNPGGEGIDASRRLQKPGYASGFNASLSYRVNKKGARSLFQANGDAAVTEFAGGLDSGLLWASTYNARARVSSDLTPKTTFSAGGGGTYAPFYQYAPFLKEGNEASLVVPTYGIAVASEWIGSYDAGAAITNRPTRKVSISASVGWRRAQDGNLQANPFGDVSTAMNTLIPGSVIPAITAQWVETRDAAASIVDAFSARTSFGADVGWRQAEQVTGPQPASVETQTAHAVLTHNLTRKLSLHAGYAITHGRYALAGDSPSNIYHTLDVGLGYGDGVVLTLAQRWTLSLSTDMSIVRNGEAAAVLAQGGANANQQTAFRINGNATLSHAIGRTWSMSTGYARATSYVVGFHQPFFSDSASGGVTGQVAPRVQFSAGVTYLRGELAFSQGNDSLKATLASTRLTYGLARFVGLYAQYSYYIYDIPSTFGAIQLPPTQRRRSASVGVSAWLPILGAGSRGPRGS